MRREQIDNAFALSVILEEIDRAVAAADEAGYGDGVRDALETIEAGCLGGGAR
jgi:hypothetical protein